MFICFGGFVVVVFGFLLLLFCLDKEIFPDSLIRVLDKLETLNNPTNFTLQARILDCGFVQTYDV